MYGMNNVKPISCNFTVDFASFFYICESYSLHGWALKRVCTYVITSLPNLCQNTGRMAIVGTRRASTYQPVTRK